MTDLVLAVAHHFAVFTLVALFAGEFVLLRRDLSGSRLGLLGRLDALYGATAALVLAVGIARVLFGAAGWTYYAGNWVFWMKMAALVLVGLASVPPTIAIGRWRRAVRATPDFTPPPAEVTAARRYLYLELGLLAFIPAFAAAMARGYGA